MCNPDDDQPCVSGTPSQEQIDNDHRTLAQRQHDALVAIGRNALESGELGQHNGLPTSIIIRTTLQDLESRAGVGVTGGGTIMPIKRRHPPGRPRQPLAGGLRQGHRTGTGSLPRQTRRLPRPAHHAHRPRRRLHQTLLPRARLRQPGPPRAARLGRRRQHQRQRTRPGLRTGQPPRRQGCGWTTTINTRGDVEWIPPPPLDTGQARVNYYHRPELLLRPPEEPDGNTERGP